MSNITVEIMVLTLRLAQEPFTAWQDSRKVVNDNIYLANAAACGQALHPLMISLVEIISV